MLQTVDGKLVFVVEFDTMPELPITGLTREEAVYERLLWSAGNGTLADLFNRRRTTGTYARILQAAIETGVITEPGKYGLHHDYKNGRWNAFKIVE